MSQTVNRNGQNRYNPLPCVVTHQREPTKGLWVRILRRTEPQIEIVHVFVRYLKIINTSFENYYGYLEANLSENLKKKKKKKKKNH